ncbi:hypothetical protein QE152_g12810 [Popillia japonica]|uniref:Uncharacterized protein n=1 Tax=Popillia japonica TaxID=7064 RepID=A0AAW1LPS2_POPJA
MGVGQESHEPFSYVAIEVMVACRKSFVLGIGTTLAIFHSSGKTPALKALQKKQYILQVVVVPTIMNKKFQITIFIGYRDRVVRM